ncbi:glycosyltransferase family 2 protein [Fimbriimonas ginsengisoli]|uniref:Glycosyltransferase family 2 n=1 Tax=Fimbriimonas ginsengisoli Gsoil 348 TaxID=661478 RepID=A0A068NV28_FIMGI|nr:glycosyltransferase [Fimbriimonas ginsengisoli]AIE87222.1 glycosyltransferase family 2 [Fimbriimonas ginsengisoli Gsoil 348]
MSTPLVSIVVPSYNHAQFLRAGLAAARAQSMPDWEMILIDDGSSDDSVEIARDVASEDDRIQVFVNERNLGTYGTQERARSIARGRYIAVLNSDDLWEPTKLQAQVELLEEHDEACFAYTLGWKIDENGVVDRSDDVHFDWPTTPIQELLPYLLYENRVLASSVLFRADDLRFEPSMRYSGDWVALLGSARRGPAACVPERLTYWRIHSSNTFVRSPNQVHEEIRVRRAIHEDWSTWFVGRIPKEKILRGLGMNVLNLAALEILRGERTAAVGAAISAARILPDKRMAVRRLGACLLPKARERLWPRDETKFEGRTPSLLPLRIP